MTTLTSNAGTMPLSRAPPSAARWRSVRSYAARRMKWTTRHAGRCSEAARRGVRGALVLTHCGAGTWQVVSSPDFEDDYLNMRVPAQVTLRQNVDFAREIIRQMCGAGFP